MKVRTSKVLRIGNSCGVTIGKKSLTDVGLCIGDTVETILTENTITFRKIEKIEPELSKQQ